MRTASRSIRVSLQLGVAGLGTLVILGSLVGFAMTFATMSRSPSGFAEGLAIIVFGLCALAGFVVLAAGLSIPQHDGSGVRFSPRQRKLLGYGVVAPIVGVLSVPIGATLLPPLSEPILSVLVGGVVGLLVSGPLATLLAVVLKLRERLSPSGRGA